MGKIINNIATPIAYLNATSVADVPPDGWKLSSELSVWDMGSGVPEITKQKGPIVNDPQIYNLFVGNWSTNASKLRMARLDQFTSDLLNSSYMSIMAQYGCDKPGRFIKSVVIFSNQTKFSDSEFHDLIQGAVTGNIIPEPKPNDVFMIYLPDGASVEDPALGITMCSTGTGSAFGYHHYFKTTGGHTCYYAIIPGLTDACLNKTCYGQLNCSLKLTETQEERQTQVASHEIIEILTNPESTAWYDVITGGEIGDICNGYADTITVGKNKWKVQQIYSKLDDIKTSGRNVCVTKSEYITPAPTGNITASVIGRLMPDVNSTYNLIGGVALLIIAMLIGKRSIIGRMAFGLFGFAFGFYLTDLVRGSLTVEQKDLVKNRVRELGNLAS